MRNACCSIRPKNKRNRSFLTFVITFGFLIGGLLSGTLNAQSTTATLSGTVTDEKDALIPGASVTVVNTNTGARRQVVTSENGVFVLPLLPPSNYSVTIEQPGFSTVEVKDVILNVNDQRSLQIQLKVGSINDVVTVEGGAPLVETQGGGVSTVVDRRFIENAPLNGRRLQ